MIRVHGLRWWLVGAVWGTAALPAFADDLGGSWTMHGNGTWVRAYEFRPVVKQASAGANGRAVPPGVALRPGSAARCVIEVGPNTRGAGIVVLADERGEGGVECLIGGTGQMRGFTVRSADGKVLWADEWAPWMEYEPCVVEAVVDRGRIRAQLFMVDGATLISQSDWIGVDPKLTEGASRMGLVADKGIARFWDWRVAGEPLAALTNDAPNKRRIVPGPTSPWIVVGPMTWEWTSAAHDRLRQTGNVERGWAFDKQVHGTHRQWSCRVKVGSPSGGAGLVFQADGTGKNGLLAWLGGTYGNGCLLLYDLSKGYTGTLWGGPQGKWQYDTDYVIVGETKPGKVRAMLLAGDGKTVVTESPWIGYDKGVTDREGMIGFHTWKGPSEFWAFTGGAPFAGEAKPAGEPAAAALGEPWLGSATSWRLQGKADLAHLAHVGKGTDVAINRGIRGIHGIWRCTVRPGDHATAELLFQVAEDAKTGFAARLEIEGGKATLRWVDLAGEPRWYSNPLKHASGTSYVLEGISTTDRVRVRLRSADGRRVLADSGELYVSDRHNARVGSLGVRASGPADFHAWSFKAE